MAVNGKSNTGRQLASYRKLVKGNCAWCSKPFLGLTSKKYCSLHCFAAHRREMARGGPPVRYKLSHADYEQIAQSKESGKVLAERFGVSQALISKIRNGERKRVTPD